MLKYTLLTRYLLRKGYFSRRSSSVILSSISHASLKRIKKPFLGGDSGELCAFGWSRLAEASQGSSEALMDCGEVAMQLEIGQFWSCQELFVVK